MTLRMLYDNANQRGDLDRTGGGNFIDDFDLETAVLISLFTEARAQPGDEFSELYSYKGGWWGDVAAGENDRIGSRLWQLRRKKATLDNLALARIFILECLQWMIVDGVTKSIVVRTFRGVSPVDLGFEIEIKRPGEAELWARTWEIQFDAL